MHKVSYEGACALLGLASKIVLLFVVAQLSVVELLAVHALSSSCIIIEALLICAPWPTFPFIRHAQRQIF